MAAWKTRCENIREMRDKIRPCPIEQRFHEGVDRGAGHSSDDHEIRSRVVAQQQKIACNEQDDDGQHCVATKRGDASCGFQQPARTNGPILVSHREQDFAIELRRLAAREQRNRREQHYK